jgi:Ca2+-transporting ATPase
MAELSIILLGLIGVTVFGWPLPILVIQMLAIDLLAEILPLTALAFDPGSNDIMTAPPRKQSEHILNKYTMLEILFLGALMGSLAFGNFWFFMERTGVELSMDHALYHRATTLSYTTIAFCQFINILSRRYNYNSLFNSNFWTNRKLLWSVVISIGLILSAIYIPFMNRFVAFSPLMLNDWMYVLIATVIFLFAHELIKVFKRIRQTS